MSKKKKKIAAFSLLELMVTIAIIATLLLFAVPIVQDWQVRNSFERSADIINSYLQEARQYSYARNTTARLETTQSGNNFIVTLYTSATPTSSCNNSGTWNTASSANFTLHSSFTITGNGIGNICFFRDGSSTGGNFAITETNNPAKYNISATISIIIATGFIDMVIDR